MIQTPNPNHRSGFSLLELLAVVTILGVVAAVVLPRISISGVEAKKQMCKQHIAEVNRALERYYVTTGDQLSDTTNLNSADYFPDGVPVCPLNGQAYQIDDVTKRVKPCSCGSGSASPASAPPASPSPVPPPAAV